MARSTLATTALGLLMLASPAASADRPPNLLFILSDQHTQRVTGCYGDPLVETPNLDRLAATAG